MFRYLLPLSLVAPPLAASSPIAEVVCAPKAQMERRLTGQMGITRQAMGLRGPEEVMELWTGEDGDWTLVVTYASGSACIVAMGEAWQGVIPRDPA